MLKPISNIQLPLRKLQEYRIDNKGKIKQNKKEYHIDNKEKFNQKSKQYRMENREKIKENKNNIINCCCGHSYTHTNRARHLKSPKHLNITPKPKP